MLQFKFQCEFPVRTSALCQRGGGMDELFPYNSNEGRGRESIPCTHNDVMYAVLTLCTIRGFRENLF